MKEIKNDLNSVKDDLNTVKDDLSSVKNDLNRLNKSVSRNLEDYKYRLTVSGGTGDGSDTITSTTMDNISLLMIAIMMSGAVTVPTNSKEGGGTDIVIILT